METGLSGADRAMLGALAAFETHPAASGLGYRVLLSRLATGAIDGPALHAAMAAPIQ